MEIYAVRATYYKEIEAQSPEDAMMKLQSHILVQSTLNGVSEQIEARPKGTIGPIATNSIRKVLDAWMIAGPQPKYHKMIKARLIGMWPVLGKALMGLEKDKERIAKQGQIIKSAKEFVHKPETWGLYEDLKRSNSMDIPVEFVDLCYAVAEVYGGPNGTRSVTDSADGNVD